MISRSLLRRLSVADLREAIRHKSRLGKVEALESKRNDLQRQLDRVERKLAKLTGSNGSPAPGKSWRRGRRKGFKVSPSTRAKMRAAALRRYGKNKPEEAKSRRKWRMSAEGRQRIAAAARRRWAAVKAAKERPKAEAKA